jgi:hypothetical protein
MGIFYILHTRSQGREDKSRGLTTDEQSPSPGRLVRHAPRPAHRRQAQGRLIVTDIVIKKSGFSGFLPRPASILIRAIPRTDQKDFLDELGLVPLACFAIKSGATAFTAHRMENESIGPGVTSGNTALTALVAYGNWLGSLQILDRPNHGSRPTKTR